MRQYFTTMRQAIAMIELIFAIVVMGIVMLSVPQLLSTASQSGIVSIQQEAINEASTQANIIMGHYWDENNITGHDTPLLYTTNGVADLNNTSGDTVSPRRIGTPANSARLFIGASGKSYFATLPLGSEGGDRDDIDDFNDTTYNLRNFETSTHDYIEKTTINIANGVSYISDAVTNGTYQDPGNTDADNDLTFDLNTTAMPAGQSTNIKHITVTLTSTSAAQELNQKQIVLHAFSCNIGSYKLEERP